MAAVRALLADVRQNGVGRRYLIQHSAGSGKSNSIAWLANQLNSYYRLIKTLVDDPMFDEKRAMKKFRRYVESDRYPISVKAEMMVEHFHDQVIAKGKIGGQARAMVVTTGIERAIDYYYAICRCLEARKSPYKAVIAFSGDKEYDGKTVNESSINGFPSSAIEKTFKSDPYRFLIVADKFQTGYDEPLLHTMYMERRRQCAMADRTYSGDGIKRQNVPKRHAEFGQAGGSYGE